MCRNCGGALGRRNKSGFCGRCRSARYRLDPAYRERIKARSRTHARARYSDDHEYRERHKAAMRAAQRERWRAISADPARRAAHNAYQLAYQHKRMLDRAYAEHRRQYRKRWWRRSRGVPVEDRFCLHCGALIRPGNQSGYCKRQECRQAWRRRRRRDDPEWRGRMLAAERSRRVQQRERIAQYKRQWRRRRQLEELLLSARSIIESNPALAAGITQSASERVAS